MTKLDQLPSEILSLILSNFYQWELSPCALVNKSFYRETMPLLWHEIHIRSKKSLGTFTTWSMQLPNVPGQHVRTLVISSLEEYTDVLEHVQDVPSLEPLGSLQHIPRYFPHLTSLRMKCRSDLDPVAYRIAQATIASVGHYCKQLTELYIDRCVYSNYDDLFDALKDAPLTLICLTLPDKLDSQVVQRFLETAPLALHRYPLTHLSIYVNDDTTSFIKTINTHGLTWPHLTNVNLPRCYSLTDAMALLFVQTNPTIESLGLDHSLLTDVFLDSLVLPNLTYLSLDFTAVTAPGICRLITNYDGRLEKVHCVGCDINPEDVPKDKTYHYSWVWDQGDYYDVGYFIGTHEVSDSELKPMEYWVSLVYSYS